MELRKRLAQLSHEDKYPFHMPGHKGRFSSLIGNFDTTEIPGLDNLHCPQDVLSRAQDTVAGIYKAAKTYFLVNGSSVGIMAAIAALTKPGDCVLVVKNCHKSVLAGLVHSGAMPVWIDQSLCPNLRHWLPPSTEAVKELIAKYSIKAAIFTNPDYYGLAPDITSLAQVCQKAGIAVIVDEAHGAHLHWGKTLGLPQSAIDAGCDIIVQSPHKTLPALTQAAWMHITDLALEEQMQETLNLFHTTSPSYLLLSSLEYAGDWASSYGSVMLRRLKILADVLNLRCKQLNLDFPQTLSNRDWTKFLLPNRRGLVGLLRSQGIFPELIQGDKVLFMLTMADALVPQGIAALYRLLPLIEALPEIPGEEIILPPLPKQEITPREAWQRPGEKVSLAKARGRIARQVLAPYPPGTMVVAPGQRLESEHVDYLQKLHAKKVIPQWLEVI
jgi:arginine/lysine/ornithine decarboxylase